MDLLLYFYAAFEIFVLVVSIPEYPQTGDRSVLLKTPTYQPKMAFTFSRFDVGSMCRKTLEFKNVVLAKPMTGHIFDHFSSDPNRRHYHVKKMALPKIVLKPKRISKAKYGGRHMVALLPGSGIGPELMGYVLEVFRYAGVPVDFEEVLINAESDDNVELENAILAIKRNGVALKGNIETNSLRKEIISRNVAIRNELDLFVNVLHCHSYPGVECRQKDINIFIIRQNTEGEYAMLEHEVGTPGIIECMKVVTRKNAIRLSTYAFEFARQNGRTKVCTVHKANIMKQSDGTFLEVSKEIAKRYPEIQHSDMIIDNCCMQLVSNPHQFDVILTTNLYGSIVSNVICGMLGGAGLLSGSNYGDEYAVFETGTRNTGSAIAGKNIANPISMMNASVDLLRHLQLTKHSKMLQAAIDKTVNIDRIHTPDLGGQATSTDVMKNIIEFVRENHSDPFGTVPTFD